MALPAPRWLRREVLVGLALGQFVSLLITSTGFSSSELARRGQKGKIVVQHEHLFGLSLILVCFCSLLPSVKWYYYLILSIVDVEANYIVVKAYQYTSLTSVMLLDCWAIPCVLFLTWIFLKTKYGLRKLFGVGICVAGVVLVVFSDVHASERKSKGPSPLKGDMLVIAGATLYAVSNVTEVLPFIGFALAMFLFYSTVPIILKICGATMLNLSLLTSDMWAVLIRIFAYHEKVDWMYFVAFAGTAIGLIIYSYNVTSSQLTTRTIASRGSREAAEDTAQVAGATDEEAATENRTAERVPGAGEDDGPDSNKSPSEAATSR
ncbi:hypothetical protein TRIUR3_15093 [Triticum urartu]|uniref:Solute carrier family 35 member F1 n=1 Tax=Triticum urartu TaxID=4572 RepID=M7Z1X7_TRIUA|nr:hypothetical protein TRIUR3_15093 [Triticum urartu]